MESKEEKESINSPYGNKLEQNWKCSLQNECFC